MSEQDCDAWLLTEVSDRVSLPGFVAQHTTGRMTRQQHWAAVYLRAGSALPDPDPGTAAMIDTDEVTYWSSVLPWLPVGAQSPWRGDSHGDRVSVALDALRNESLGSQLVWGGDWNHSLGGPVVGSRAGREAIMGLVDLLDLQVPTAGLPHRRDGLRSIDHVAVPASWRVRDCSRVPGTASHRTLSDHDLYVVDVDPR